ncbi:MAG: MBL fold metallo-hydrolase [Candidatus Thorarchaeota archaeon]|jgi:cyclase
MHHPFFDNQEVHEFAPGVLSTKLAHYFNKLGVNAGIIETPDSIVFIDSGASAYSGEFQWNLAHERMDVNKDLYLIITHRDMDHYFGMGAIREQGAQVMAHPHAAESMKANKDFVKNTSVIRAREKYAPDDVVGEVVVSEPDKLITEDITLKVGEEVQILVIPGHTAGDIAVHHPRSKVLFTGDAILEGMNPKIHSDSLNLDIWIRNLERLKDLDTEWVVPGHGAISKPDIIDHNIQFLQAQIQ